MPGLAPTDIDDLVAASFPSVDKNKFNDLASAYQKHPVTRQMMKKKRRAYDGGKFIERDMMVRKSGSARATGLHEQDRLNIINLSDKITVPFRFYTANWSYDVREEEFNRGIAAIWNLIRMREKATYVDQAENFEDDFWTALAATADPQIFFGVDYWINKANATTGFNGGDPTGFAAGAGGITVAAVDAWKNFSAEYTNVTKADAIQKIRTAITKTDWTPPVDMDDFKRGTGQDIEIFTNYDALLECENLGESQNDNLGRDLASMDGKMLLRGFPLIWVPKLDANAKDPFYGIDWNWFEFCFQRGAFMRRSHVKHTSMHNERSVHLDTTVNTMCTNRRAQFVVQKA